MSAPLRILHVVADLDGYGLTRQLEMLVREQISSGHDIRVVALSATREAVAMLRQLSIGCRVLDRRWQCDPCAAIRLAGELRRQSFEVLHLWGQQALDYFKAVRQFVGPQPALTSLPESTLFNSQPHGYIAPGIASPCATSLGREQFLAEQLLSADSILIAAAGPLTRTQQIDEAIWFFELVRTLDDRVRLLIFGDGPDRHRLERFSRLASEPSEIRFLGYRTDFRELLQHLDLFWHTAAPNEALPLTVLEAMSSGVPVVANDGPACRRIINDQENGYLVFDNDRAVFARQTRRILHDTQQAQALIENAKQTIAERFSVDAMTQAYAQQYEALLS